MKSNKVAVVLTRVVNTKAAQPSEYREEEVTIPTSRIAFVEPVLPGFGNARSKVTLRTPEDYLYVVESPRGIAKILNGEVEN